MGVILSWLSLRNRKMRLAYFQQGVLLILLLIAFAICLSKIHLCTLYLLST